MSFFWLALRRDRFAFSAFFVVIFFMLMALGVSFGFFAGDWDQISNLDGYSGISRKFWLGSNFNGQSILSRAVFGSKMAFMVGGSAAIGSLLIGFILGCVSGFFRETMIDEVILWLQGCIDAIPIYLWVAAMGFVSNDSEWTILFAMIATFWTPTCKIVRAQTIKLAQAGFIESAFAIGASSQKIITQHLMPNLLPFLLAEFTLVFANAIKVEAALSFLGLGNHDFVSWGQMLAEATGEILTGHLLNFYAATGFMFSLVLSLNILCEFFQKNLHPIYHLRE